MTTHRKSILYAEYGGAGLAGTRLALAFAFALVSITAHHVNAQTPATAPAEPRLLSLPGVIMPDERVEIFAKVSGYVSRISVDIGSPVHRGDTLVQLDVPELADELHQAQAVHEARSAKVKSLEARVEQARLQILSAEAEEKRAKAERELAETTYRRKSELFKGNAIPAQEFDVVRNTLTLADAQITIASAKTAGVRGDYVAAQADVKAGEAERGVAAADVERIQTLIRYTTIKAPFDGVITRRSVDHGAFVRSAAQGAGSSLLTIDKLDRVRLVVEIPENETPSIRVGSVVRATLRAWGDRRLETKISRTALAVTGETRTMRAEIDLENPGLRLLPGMYARVELPLSPSTATRPGG